MDLIGRLATRYPAVVVAGFLAFWVLAGALFLRDVRYDFSFRTMVPRSAPEFARFETFQELFPGGDEVFVVVFRDDPLFTAENLELVERLTRRLENLQGTDDVLSLVNAVELRGTEEGIEIDQIVDGIPRSERELASLADRFRAEPLYHNLLLSEDGRTTAIVVRLEGRDPDPRAWTGYFERVRRILREEGAGRIEFHLAGVPVLDQAVLDRVFADGRFYIPLILALYTLLLALTFRRVRAAWVPLTPMLIAATGTMAAIGVSGLPLGILTGSNTLPVLVMVIGFADAVHLLAHWEDDLARSPDRDRTERIRVAVRHVGFACFLTSVTTAVGLASMGLSDVTAIRDFGLFGALGVMLVYAVVVLLLPAALVLTERWRPARPRTVTGGRFLDHGLLATAGFVIRWRRSVITGSLLLLVASVALIPKVRMDSRFSADLRRNDPVLVSQRFVETHLGGMVPLEVLVRERQPGMLREPWVLRELDDLARQLEALPEVSRVVSHTSFLKRLNQALHAGDPEARRIPVDAATIAQELFLLELAGGDDEYERLTTPDGTAVRMTVLLRDVPPEESDRVRETFTGSISPRLDEAVDVQFSGAAVLMSVATRTVITQLLQSLYLAMPVIFVIIAITFRSLRVGLLCALPNVIPLTVALGVLGLTGVPLRFATMVAFPLAFGIAVDDTIHFMTRYRRAVLEGKEPEEALREAFRTTGRAMVLTTLFLVGGWSVFFTSSFLASVHIAALTCVIVVVALVGDLLLLPALLLTFRPRLTARR